MSRQLTWLALIMVFVLGLLLGLLVSDVVPQLGLAALYERLGGWTLLGRTVVILLVLAIPVGYLVLLIAGAVRYARTGDQAEAELPIHYVQRGERSTVKRVLVSTRGGPHAYLGLRLATGIARAGGGEVTLFRVIPTEQEVDVESETQALEEMAEDLGAGTVPVRARATSNPSVVDGILQELREGEYDLLIVGASDEGTIQRLLFGTVPDAVVERTPCPVLIVRNPVG